MTSRTSKGGQIRAARFGVVGTLNFKRPWRYTVFAMTHTFDKGFDVDTTDEFSFGDYRLDIPLSAGLTLSVGKQKEPISMARLRGLAYLPMQERAAFIDALLPARNHGVILFQSECRSEKLSASHIQEMPGNPLRCHLNSGHLML